MSRRELGLNDRLSDRERAWCNGEARFVGEIRKAMRIGMTQGGAAALEVRDDLLRADSRGGDYLSGGGGLFSQEDGCAL